MRVLVGACADRTSVSTLCASSQNSPAGNTVLYHLRTKFEPEQLERVITLSCERISMNCSPNGWRSAQTSTCGFYGDEDDTDGLYHSVAKRGTTAFHAYTTLRACEEQTLHAGGTPSQRRRYRK